MKHCQFTILYNELAFLKQKMEFLYDNFDQLIFYDMYALSEPYHFSTDGSHEFIKKYPDPENKITLLEELNFSSLKNFPGVSVKGKQKMFAFGSRYIRDDIDIYWCTSMDEFFKETLIKKVEDIFESNNRVKSLNIPHIIFFKDTRTVYCEPDGNYLRWAFAPRVTRHKKGNVYGHCTLGRQYSPVTTIKDEFIYHYAYIGKKRICLKEAFYWKKIVSKTDTSKLTEKCYGYPSMHPSLKKGIRRYNGDHPSYIDLKEMEIMLNR